jgi:hypothetical protein
MVTYLTRVLQMLKASRLATHSCHVNADIFLFFYFFIHAKSAASSPHSSRLRMHSSHVNADPAEQSKKLKTLHAPHMTSA